MSPASSDPPVDLEKGAAWTNKEEELAVVEVNHRVAKCIIAYVDVMMVLYSVYIIGVIIYMFKVSANWWDAAWPAAVIVLPIWALSLWMHFHLRAEKLKKLGSNDSNPGLSFSVSYNPSLDLEKGSGGSTATKEELAKVNPREHKCSTVFLVVFMVMYLLFTMGLITWTMKVSDNNVLHGWLVVFVVWPLWVLLCMCLHLRAEKHLTLGSDDGDLSTKLVGNML